MIFDLKRKQKFSEIHALPIKIQLQSRRKENKEQKKQGSLCACCTPAEGGAMNTQRNYKDTVSRMIFRDPGNALSLYNSLNGTHYTDTGMLEFNTLENAIYMGMKNDLSFLIMNEMHLYEHQSTYTPNMPLRDLFYVADLLQVHVKEESLYSSKQIKLPTPHFVVFYNGSEERPEKTELKLSEAFEKMTETPELELKVTILNINSGKNEKLKEGCPVLKEYMQYVEKIRENRKRMPLEEAVDEAIGYCIGNGILRDFLLRQRAEVVKMSIYEYDEERELALIRRDEREIGEKIGREKERQNVEKILQEEKENNIKSIITLCQEFGSSKEVTVEKLMEQCHLTKEQAREKIACYWQ